MATSYSYDAKTSQLVKSTATDGIAVEYTYDTEGHLAKVSDATGTREFAYDLRGQVIKESVTLLTGANSPPIRYEIRRTYTALGQPESVHLVSADGESIPLDYKIEYAWNPRNQLASVKSLAGEFIYEYHAKNPALLTKMTGPAHTVETTYEPHRNLITGVTNRRKGAGIQNPGASGSFPPPAAAGTPIPAPDSQLLTPISSYSYANDLLGRRETISQGGEAFALLKLGNTKIDVAYNDRSEVVGAVYKTGNETAVLLRLRRHRKPEKLRFRSQQPEFRTRSASARRGTERSDVKQGRGNELYRQRPEAIQYDAGAIS